MKVTSFQDMHGKEVRIQFSSGGDIRIYYEAEKDNCPCILLSESQANILINAIKDLLSTE